MIRRFFFRFYRQPKVIVLVVLVIGATVAYLYQVDRVEFYQRYNREVQLVKKISNLFFLPKFFLATQLPRYDLIIDPKDWQFLDENLPQIYADQILTDKYKDKVPARLTIDGQDYEVMVRYRGDTDIHWRDLKKSWFVDFKKSGSFPVGAERIHLVIPVDRHYLLEELSFYRARKAGLVVPETRFVNLFVNGKRQGVYWQFEHWDQPFLEQHQISAETNLYGSIDFSDQPADLGDAFADIQSWRKYVENPKSADDFSELQRLFDILQLPDDEFAKRITIIDMENFYQWQINQYLLTSNHQTGINLRLYFDPTVGKFRFIPWDISTSDSPPQFYEEHYNDIITRILLIPEFLHQRNIRLWRYVGDEGNLADDLAFYDELDRLTRNDFYKDFKKVESHWAYRAKIAHFRQLVEEKFFELQKNLGFATADIVIAKPQAGEATMAVATDGFSAIEVTEMSFETSSCPSDIRLYQDTDKSRSVTPEDSLIASFVCHDGLAQAELNLMVLTAKELEGNYLVPTRNVVQLVLAGENLTITPASFKAVVHNAVTGETVEPEIIY